ncbi:MAG: Panacea domain-containing protein [Patescibacteria group bacterium]|nr:Panacea domain-containing protein [Patescibacteria group bacterium]
MNRKKFQNSVLYFVKYCNNSFLGKVKLNKLLYYLDFISYRDRQKEVTGDIYIHKSYGPVPENVDEMIAELKKDKQLEVSAKPFDSDKDRFVFSRMADPDMSCFDTYEKELLGKICEEFQNWSTDKIVNQTHLEAPWFYSSPYEFVDFKYASNIDFFHDQPDCLLHSYH